MPKLGMTMREGTVARWRVADGSPVRVKDVIFELATDKTEVEVESEHEGTLFHVVGEGTTLECGAVVAWIAGDGEDRPAEAARRPIAAEIPALAELTVSVGNGKVAAVPDGGVRRRVSPLARRLASERGVDVGALVGTGPRGRIVAADIPSTPLRSATLAASHSGAAAPSERIPLAGMRKVIAERMWSSLHEMAQLTLGATVDMDAAVALREQLVAAWEPDGLRPTFTDLVVKAAALALVGHPALNASLVDGVIERHGEVNVGIAVALDDGLVLPVLRGVDRRTLRDACGAAQELVGRARGGDVPIDDYAGATFAVTSLGAFGVDFFTPIVNPPNVAILGVGAITRQVAWRGDTPVPCSRMTLSLTVDHRAVDGAPAARFLGTLREILESPLRMLS